MSTVSHVAAQDITYEGRYLRQRCAWCGVNLIDEDLSLCMVMVVDGEPPGVPRWPVGKWIEVDEGCPTVYSVLEEEGIAPKNSCMSREFPKPRFLELVKP